AVGVEGESPAAFVLDGVGHGHREDRFQTEQSAHDQRPVGPGARATHDQAISAGFDAPAGAPVGGDAVGDVVGGAVELPGLRIRRDTHGTDASPRSPPDPSTNAAESTENTETSCPQPT